MTIKYVLVAQLDRALVCGTKGWQFESAQVHLLNLELEK